MDWLSTAALWLHVVSASWWILASTMMAVAGAVVGAESLEGREFMARVVPKLNRANALAAAILLLTGVINLTAVGSHREFSYPPAFMRVLLVKLMLYLLMVAALWASFGLGRQAAIRAGTQSSSSTYKLAALAAAIALMGATAMLLGVWLAGD